MLPHRFPSVLLPPLSSDVYCTCKLAAEHNRSIFLFLSSVNLTHLCALVQVPVWPARSRRPSMAVHLRSAQMDPAADAELQRWVHRWPERWLTHTSTHMSELTRFTRREKPLFSVSNQAAGGCHVSLKEAEGRERASCLSVVPALLLRPPLYHHPPLPEARLFIFSWMYE